ncbi:MAG: hypothetical protein HOK61_08450 [Alphaproteobacteria bacterium]|nr:hypothetical protein [Alphaproteobacteria bacterium]
MGAINQHTMHQADLWGARERMALQPHMGALASKSGSNSLELASASPADSSSLFGDDGFGFDDLLDLINPLQHIPIVSTAYRALTGDEIAPGARLMGGALFGGPIGLATAVVSTAVESATGKDIGESVLAMFSGDDDTPAEPGPMLANAGGAISTEIAALDAAPPLLVAPPPPTVSSASANTNLAPRAAEQTAPPPTVLSANIPQLSPDQVALLLNSLGLPPDAANSTKLVVSDARTSPPAANEDAPTAQASPPSTQAPAPAPLRPAAAVPADQPVPKQAVWQPFDQELDPSEMPQEMISEAMAWALDKYQTEFGETSLNPRGQTHDSGA